MTVAYSWTCSNALERPIIQVFDKYNHFVAILNRILLATSNPLLCMPCQQYIFHITSGCRWSITLSQCHGSIPCGSGHPWLSHWNSSVKPASTGSSEERGLWVHWIMCQGRDYQKNSWRLVQWKILWQTVVEEFIAKSDLVSSNMYQHYDGSSYKNTVAEDDSSCKIVYTKCQR